MRVRALTEESGGSCDWGGCDHESAMERWGGDDHGWLPVCALHGARSRAKSPGRGRCGHCDSDYALTTAGLLRMHTHGWNRCPGSGNVPKGADRA